MLTLRRSEQLQARLLAACRKYLATQTQPQLTEINIAHEHEQPAVPEYPPILDLSYKAIKERKTLEWHQEIREAATVEDKLIKINMPRYYGYKVVNLNDGKVPYNSLAALQHYTRTVFEAESETVPEKPQEAAKQLDAFVEASKGEVLEALEYAHDFFRRKHPDAATQLEPIERERLLAQIIVEQINRALTNALGADLPHLQEAETDYSPRHEAFWMVGGIDPPKNVVKSKEGRVWQKEMANDPVDRMMQYLGTPYLALRHRQQLPTWKTAAEANNVALAKEIPRYNFDPRTLGWYTSHRHGTNIPGYWPGSGSGFGFLSYQSRAHFQIRPDAYGAADHNEALHAQALQSSFAWLLAQANYNGFNTFSDLTYPMNTQTVITNGRDWSFYEYQLNTLLVHSRHIDENPRVNFCRGTDTELQLYQEVDATSGRVVGFNDAVLRRLVRCYSNAPVAQERSATELQPYLQPEARRNADHEDEERRSFVERTFKHMSSNQPRHLALPEIYLWEKLYKIDNKTRQMEAKRRYFELDINPWQRTMDQHQKEYIPRQLRPEGTKSRKKWRQTHYP